MPKRTAIDRRARALQRKVTSTASGPEPAHPPTWIKPQLTRLVDEAPAGSDWLHEIKYDGYRMHARIDGDKIQLLTRAGLDWSHRYKRTIEALRSLMVKSAYLDGELCALNARNCGETAMSVCGHCIELLSRCVAKSGTERGDTLRWARNLITPSLRRRSVRFCAVYAGKVVVRIAGRRNRRSAPWHSSRAADICTRSITSIRRLFLLRSAIQ
jgi:hypothetical protein